MPIPFTCPHCGARTNVADQYAGQSGPCASYCCPSDPGGMEPGSVDTDYVMVTGEGTAGGKPNEAVNLEDILDGTSNTILVVELANSGIPWMEPRDLTVEEILARINPPTDKGMSAHPGGINVLMCDGSVRFIAKSIDPETLRRLLLRNDGKLVGTDFDQYARSHGPEADRQPRARRPADDRAVDDVTGLR